MTYNHLFTMLTLLIILDNPTRQPTAIIDCHSTTQLLNTCSAFITFGKPEPVSGSPCCDGMVGLSNLGDSIDNRQSICMCIMGLIDAYSPNVTSIANLPGFCGVSLGFIVQPNTDCSTYVSNVALFYFFVNFNFYFLIYFYKISLRHSVVVISYRVLFSLF